MSEHTTDPADELAKCQETNEELKEENDHLRQAAGAFGELAERLNSLIREDRRDRLQGDRRGVPRCSGDRRVAACEPAEPVER